MPSSKIFGGAPEGRGCARFVFRYLNGGKHRAIHSLEGNQVPPGIGDRHVHLPIPPRRFCHGSVDNRLGLGQ